MLPECLRNSLKESKFQKFSGGASPQTPPGGLWIFAHSITIVIGHNHRSEPPHHFYYMYLFSTLEKDGQSVLMMPIAV